MAENKMEQVAALIGIEMDRPFRCSIAPGKYRLTKYGIEVFDGESWFKSKSCANILEGIIKSGEDVRYAK
jgi:hypothetical protein